MVSGSGVCAKRIVVDVRHHMLGRLSSIIAKELLNDQKVVVAHCEEICLSAAPSVSKSSDRVSNQMGTRLSVTSPWSYG
jgi:ribosomal protein L13